LVTGIRRVALLVLVAVVAGACQAGPTTTTAGTSTTGTTAVVTTTSEAVTTTGSVAGGTLVVGIGADPGHLNPAITTSGGTHTASELLYNGLVELGPQLEPIPELAESWEIEDDGRLYRFHLREGVTWHDGTPFTSADVKFTFEEVLLEFHARTRASLGPALTSVETPDDLTVEFVFEEPYAPLLLQLDVTEAPIIARHIYEGSDPNENPANTSPVGTGPFRFVSYTPESEIVFEKNPEYWKEGLPVFDQVVQRIIPDPGSQVIALENGEVDWLWGVPGPEQARLEADAAYSFLDTDRNPGGSNCIMTVSFNLENPILSDLRVRQAFAHALDRDAFVERVIFGQGRVAEAPISSGIPWAHGDVDLPAYDVTAADAVLTEAGWVREGDGVRTAQGVEGVDDGTSLALRFTHFPSFNAYGELLRAQLAEVGVEITQVPLDPPVFAETVFTERDFDTNIISYCNGNDPEIGVRRMFDSAQIGPVPFSNAAAYSNSEVDALFDEARGVIDPAARTPIYQQIQELVAADLPYFWIVETTGSRVFRAECSGFRPYGLFAEEASCAR
jgi:peptide/nickel transport system substrate-binding protein